MSEYKTSWSTSDLKQLVEITNHRITYDGYEYVWEHYLNKEWRRHFVRNFKDYKKPYGWLLNCVYRWNKELVKRSQEEDRKYFDSMFKDLEIERKIHSIAKEYQNKTKDRVLRIKELKPELSSKEIGELLEVSKRTVERYLK
jgi:Fic family protein